MNTHLERGKILNDLNRYDMAEKEFRQALGEDPMSADAHKSLAWTLNQLGRRDEARAEAEEALRLSPGWSEPHRIFGLIHRAAKDHEKAVAAFEEMNRLDPLWAVGKALLAWDLQQLGRHDEAIRAADTGLTLDATQMDCLLMKAESLLNLGRAAEAESHARSALTLNPNCFYAHNVCGQIYKEQGDLPRAVECFREALTLEPSNQFAEYWHRTLVLTLQTNRLSEIRARALPIVFGGGLLLGATVAVLAGVCAVWPQLSGWQDHMLVGLCLIAVGAFVHAAYLEITLHRSVKFSFLKNASLTDEDQPEWALNELQLAGVRRELRTAVLALVLINATLLLISASYSSLSQVNRWLQQKTDTSSDRTGRRQR